MQRLVFLAFAIRGCLASLEMHQADFKHTPFPEETCRNQAEAKHPLDPLTHDEIQSAVQIIETNKGDNATRYIYNYIALFEPPKSVLLPFFLQDSIPPENIYPRKAFLVLIEWATKFVYEAVVNLGTKQKESYIRIYNVQAPFTPVDLLKPEIEIVLTNELVQERCASLGYPNMNLVVGAPWTMGYVEDRPEYRGKRIVQYFMFGKNFAGDNYYAHPLDFVVIVDLDLRQVIAIEDLPTHNNFSTNNTANSAPKIEANYDYHYRGGDSFFRQDDNPITTSSPLGPYSILGNEIQWQKWKMRVGFNGREGMVVYMVSYNDDGRRRPILYRASVTEIFVPYGDPRPPFHRKSVYDMGEYGLGYHTDQQTLHEDVLGTVHFFSAVLHNTTGGPVPYKNAISLREEDAGISWQHADYRTGQGLIARSHRLVLSTWFTLGNYDYTFSWQFYQDGSIQFVAGLTGSVSTSMIAAWATRSGFGTPTAVKVNAQHHQHFFTVRLDTEIDGTYNSVATMDVVPLKNDAQNPYGQGFTVNETLLRTAGEARTKISPLTGRTWTIMNPSVLHNYTGKPVAWKLIPVNSPPLLMREDSKLRTRAGFLNWDVWVTQFKEDELFPGGFYLNNSGLPVWVGSQPDANVEKEDVVVWHNFGTCHIPRVEDYPLMSVELTGFWLKPYNFFLENPAIDVPPAMQ